jgi:hypothetical protein
LLQISPILENRTPARDIEVGKVGIFRRKKATSAPCLSAFVRDPVDMEIVDRLAMGLSRFV